MRITTAQQAKENRNKALSDLTSKLSGTIERIFAEVEEAFAAEPEKERHCVTLTAPDEEGMSLQHFRHAIDEVKSAYEDAGFYTGVHSRDSWGMGGASMSMTLTIDMMPCMEDGTHTTLPKAPEPFCGTFTRDSPYIRKDDLLLEARPLSNWENDEKRERITRYIRDFHAYQGRVPTRVINILNRVLINKALPYFTRVRVIGNGAGTFYRNVLATYQGSILAPFTDEHQGIGHITFDMYDLTPTGNGQREVHRTFRYSVAEVLNYWAEN